MILRKGKVQDKKLKIFQNNYLKFLSKHFVEKGKEKLFPIDSSFLSNLGCVKTNNILTIQI